MESRPLNKSKSNQRRLQSRAFDGGSRKPKQSSGPLPQIGLSTFLAFFSFGRSFVAKNRDDLPFSFLSNISGQNGKKAKTDFLNFDSYQSGKKE